MANQSNKKWYELLPWWGWILSIILSSQLSNYLANNFDGVAPAAIAAALGFFMLYSFVALIVWLFTIPARRKRNSTTE